MGAGAGVQPSGMGQQSSTFGGQGGFQSPFSAGYGMGGMGNAYAPPSQVQSVLQNAQQQMASQGGQGLQGAPQNSMQGSPMTGGPMQAPMSQSQATAQSGQGQQASSFGDLFQRGVAGAATQTNPSLQQSESNLLGGMQAFNQQQAQQNPMQGQQSQLPAWFQQQQAMSGGQGQTAQGPMGGMRGRGWGGPMHGMGRGLGSLSQQGAPQAAAPMQMDAPYGVYQNMQNMR